MAEYAFYLRKSRKDLDAEKQGQGETLARHMEMLVQLAERNGVNNYDIYKEIVSGETISARPEMQRLLEAVWDGVYKAVFVVEVERLARGNTRDQGEVAEAFQYSHTKIITCIKTYDPDNEYDQEFFEFSLFMSRREFQTIKRRMQAGRAASKLSGNYTYGRRIFGYNPYKSGKTVSLVPNEEEAPYVRMIFEMCAKGNSASSIANWLNQIGVKTVTGGEWYRALLLDMLRNPLYMGKIRWHKDSYKKNYDRASNSYKIDKRKRLNEDAIIVEGKHPAIVDEEVWNAVQEIIPKIVPRNREQVDPLAGLLFCSVCGQRLRMTRFANHPEYTAHYNHVKGSGCGLPTLRSPDLIDELCYLLQRAIVDFEIEDGKKTVVVDPMPRLESELDKEQKKRVRIFTAFEEGVYNSAEFAERKQASDNRIKELELAIEKERKLKAKVVDIAVRRNTFYEAVDLLRSDEVSAKDKNTFLKTIIEKVEYSPEGMHLFLL